MSPPQNLFGALRAFKALVARLRPNKTLAACAILALLVTGALETASVAMLVPLLEALTAPDGSSHGSAIEALRRVLPGVSRDQLLFAAAGGVLGLIIFKNLTAYLAIALTGRLRGKAVIELRRQLLDQMLHTPLHVFENKTTGDLADLMLVEAAKTTLALDLLIYSMQRATMALSYLSAILLLSWQLTLLTAALGLGLTVNGLLLARRILRHSRQTSEANSDLARRVTEIFGGLRLVRATHSEEAEAKRFAEVSSRHAGLEAKATQLSTLSLGINEALGVSGAMGVTAFASHFLLQRGELSVAQFLAFGFGLMRLLPVLNQLHGVQASIVGLSGSTAKLLDWLSFPPSSTRPVGAASLTRLEQGIEIDSLGFRYASGTQALRNLSCFIPAGSFFAIVGPSGSGKSTLANLMLRLLEPTSGHVRFDGRDYWEFSPRDYHRFVAYVEQDPFLFHATIAENVAYGVDASREQILEALRTVQLDQMVSALPQGLDTMIGERGATLSGGQRQRLAIARALVRSPQLLILDEPTSALDPTTEREVVDAIEAARVGRTAVVIAHRMGTIARADFVLHLKDGSVHELESRTPPGHSGVERTWVPSSGTAVPDLPSE